MQIAVITPLYHVVTFSISVNRVVDGGNDLPPSKDVNGDLEDLDATLAQKMAANQMLDRSSMPQGIFFGMANKVIACIIWEGVVLILMKPVIHWLKFENKISLGGWRASNIIKCWIMT